uniref:HAT C-terminal dimerisation domain-containing protein n=1 Tax=Fagus sylvatica TaxID=28930 RepID=A0A2N9HVG9_FAGSY
MGIDYLITNTEKQEKKLVFMKKQVFDPSKELNDMKVRMAYLEWYRKLSKDNKIGYYDNYKNASHTSDLEITKHMKALTCYWEQIVDEAEKRPQTVGTSLRTRWLFAGTNYQRMIEPLFIAEYYKDDHQRDYINQGRAKHFKQLEQWYKETQKPASGPNDLKKQNMASILTEDPCFWAHFEEARISCKLLSSKESSVGEKESSKHNLIEFGNYLGGVVVDGVVAWEIGLGFLLIFETGLGLPVGNRLGGVVVDGVVAWPLGLLADLGMGVGFAHRSLPLLLPFCLPLSLSFTVPSHRAQPKRGERRVARDGYVGLDLGFGHGGEPRVMVGYTLQLVSFGCSGLIHSGGGGGGGGWEGFGLWLGVKAEPPEPMAPTESSHAAPLPLATELPIPVIGKDDHETDWYGAACGVGVFNSLENRTALTVPNHKGETIGKVVEKCLREWGIDIVLTITVDNASSNDMAIDYLRRKMKLKESCIVGCEFLHMRCCAHILNLIVQDGLKDIHESIAKVRNAMWWNSTYLMLKATEKFERAFDRLIIDDEQYMDYFEEPDGNGKKPKGPPRSLDWENVRLLCMKMKYEKYWGNIKKMNLLLFVAVILDPRYKMKYIVYWFNKWYAKPKAETMVEKVRGAIDRLYAHYATKFETASSSASGSISCVTSDVASSSMSSASDKHDPWKSAVGEFQHHLAQEDNGECKIEVDQYLSEASEPPCALGFDILGWWRVNSSKYKILSHVARDVMAVLVSTVASESTFSTGGRVLDSFRSSLSPLTVETLICCQNWLRSTSSPVKLREAMDKVQSIDEELESGFEKVIIEGDAESVLEVGTPDEAKFPSFSSGLELANLVVTSHLPYHSWAAVRELYREICQEVGPSSSSSVRFKVDQQPNFTIIAFFTWPAHSKIYIEGGGGGDLYHSISSSTLKETFPFFEFLCTKTNPHFSINKAALDLFHSIRGSLPYLKSQVPL